MASVVHDVSGDHRTDEQQQQQKQAESEDQQEAPANSSSSQTMVSTTLADYVTPYAPHEVGHAMAFLTGCSAGGLSTYIHCDDFRALLPKASTVKCLADGGFFLDVEDISGRRYMRDFYNDVARLQDLRKRFPHCSSDMEPGQCLFPREVAKGITTPMFILNPAYDVWQVEHVLTPEGSDPQRLWQNCRLDITKCDSKQLETLQGFRKELLDATSEFKERRGWGMFIDSCFIHCQSMNPLTWHSPSASRINNKTSAEAVGDWFFDRREVKEIDREYPGNPTCYNAVLDRPYKEE